MAILKQRWQCDGDKVTEIVEAVVYTFTVSGTDDPVLFAAEPLHLWEISDDGKWVMEHALEKPVWHSIPDHQTAGYKYAISATLRAEDYTYWSLRYK